MDGWTLAFLALLSETIKQAGAKNVFFILMYEGMRAYMWRAVIHYNGSLSNMMQHYSRVLGKDRFVDFKSSDITLLCQEIVGLGPEHRLLVSAVLRSLWARHWQQAVVNTGSGAQGGGQQGSLLGGIHEVWRLQQRHGWQKQQDHKTGSGIRL